MPIVDSFSGAKNVSSPATKQFDVVPSDEKREIPFLPKALFIGTGGNISVALIDNPNSFSVYKNVPSGTFLPLRAVFVNASGTTATDIVAVG
uniref:spike base protein, RCAP_Rcc01079 family n=1 Tax=Nitrospira cf. moscoviensis SBR1015 TaxID=96242 RepID=UPI00111F3827|nr:hypothetical protein [Nitrospira cf. moscoviensis SBR1015]